MQEWFAEGKCCDMIIEIQLPDEVSSGPSTRKRKRTEGEKVEIKAHSVVLGARSRHIRYYIIIWIDGHPCHLLSIVFPFPLCLFPFSTCMTRGFEGTGNKKITITLADEQGKNQNHPMYLFLICFLVLWLTRSLPFQCRACLIIKHATPCSQR